MEDLLRWIVIGAAGGYALIYWVSGLFTPVAGRWRDGERIISLRQAGPFVRGLCIRDGGEEIYRGTARFGRLTLQRKTRGEALLMSMGFAAEVAPLLEDQVMATYEFKLKGDSLNGTFSGRVIRSLRSPPRIVRVQRRDDEPRSWQRLR
jgi:hypothetical protein